MPQEAGCLAYVLYKLIRMLGGRWADKNELQRFFGGGGGGGVT